MVKLHELFELRVKQRGTALALKYEDGTQLSYSQLNDKAQALTSVLVGLGVGEDNLVAIKTERCVGMIVGLLGILKANAGYIPIDPIYPADRQQFMLEDSKSSVLVVSSALAKAEAISASISTVIIDEHGGVVSVNPATQTQTQTQTQTHTQSTQSTQPELGDRSLAYVLYTSGSTGKPKGVMIEHRSVVNLLNWFAGELQTKPSDVILGLTTFCFDISILEMFLPLTQGAVLCLVSANTQRDPEQLLSILSRERVTMMQATPATLEMLTHVGWTGDARLDVLCGGEAFRLNLAPIVPRCRSFRNVYGPTETTIWSSSYTMTGTPKSIPPIGKPISQTTFHVLNEQMGIVEEGKVGELYIGGIGLARGYLGRQDLTEKMFVKNPFGQGKLYRTGDLAKKEGDNYVCLGRLDSQVKIRGYRVELGEIEKVLQVASGVQTAVVLARDDIAGLPLTLVAYVKMQADTILDQHALSRHLAVSLPPYMVPPLFVNVDVFPQTPNGKIDRKALKPPPPPSAASAAPAAEHTASQSGVVEIDIDSRQQQQQNQQSELEQDPLIEHIIAMIRQHTGAVVKPESSLASIGIDSISSVLFVRKLSASLGNVPIPVSTLYQAESVRALAAAIKPQLKQNSHFNKNKLLTTRNATSDEREDQVDIDKPDNKVMDAIRNSIPITQGIRGVLILWVMFEHFHWMAHSTKRADMQNNTEYFMLLSGFGTMLQLTPSWDWKRFLVSRAWGIFPLYYTALILYIPYATASVRNQPRLQRFYHHPTTGDNVLAWVWDYLAYITCMQTWNLEPVRISVSSISYASAQWNMYLVFTVFVMLRNRFPSTFRFLDFQGDSRTRSRTLVRFAVISLLLVAPSIVHSSIMGRPRHPWFVVSWIPIFMIGMGSAKVFVMVLEHYDISKYSNAPDDSSGSDHEHAVATKIQAAPFASQQARESKLKWKFDTKHKLMHLSWRFMPDVIVAILIVGIVVPPGDHIFNIILECAIFKLFGAIFLVLTVLQTPECKSLTRTWILENSLLQQIGQLSYPIYLTHSILINWYLSVAINNYWSSFLPPKNADKNILTPMLLLEWIIPQSNLLKIFSIVLSIAVGWIYQHVVQEVFVPWFMDAVGNIRSTFGRRESHSD